MTIIQVDGGAPLSVNGLTREDLVARIKTALTSGEVLELSVTSDGFTGRSDLLLSAQSLRSVVIHEKGSIALAGPRTGLTYGHRAG